MMRRKRIQRHHTLGPAFAAAFAVAVVAASAQAIDFNWNVAGPADWDVGTNWDPEGPPSGGGGNHAFVNNGGTAEISSDIGDFQDIFVGAGDGTSGNLNQTGGATFQGTGSWMFVGQDGGTGVYNLSGGTANKERLYIGRGAGGDGTLNLSGNGVVGGALFISGVDGGVGTVNVSESGSINTTGNIELQNANVTIGDSALLKSSNEIWFGNGGGNSSTTNMDSGSVEADTWIAIGRDSAEGTVNLSGTARMAKNAVPGNENSERSFITLGGLGAGTGGTLNISEEAVLESDTNMILGESDGRFGIVNQSGGTVTLHDNTNETAIADGLSASVLIGRQFISGDDPPVITQSIGEYHLSGGSLNAETIDARFGLFNMTGGVLSATEFQGDLTQGGGTVSPGESPGITLIGGNYTLVSGDLLVELDGLAGAGVTGGHDQVIVTGDVTLAGDLTVSLGYAPSIGDMFTIIDNQGANAVIGAFQSVAAAGFTVSYTGGDGNDVVLTAIPEPASLALLGLGLVALAAARRRM